ncbi:MAG: hypothetical protein QOF48_1383 [Verrucomicrobiota bacterium]
MATMRIAAAEFALKTAEQPVPKEIGESIRAVMQAKSLQLMRGDKPSLEIWIRQEVPLKSKPVSSNDALGAIPETTLLGVVTVKDSSLHDYKDNEIPRGIYTARFGLQPKDGDHLGTAEFDFFLVLVAAENDRELAGLDKFRAMVKASGKSTPSGHPLVVSLRPASGEGIVPRLTEPVAEHKAIRVSIPGKTTGGEASPVAFDLVWSGHGHIQ